MPHYVDDRDPRALAVRDDRRAGRRRARADRGRARPRGAARPRGRRLRRARRRPAPRSASSTRAGLDYVSCSPFRVPIARVAAAQAAARDADGRAQRSSTRSSSSTYWPRCRGPRKWSRTRACAASPMRSARAGRPAGALTRAPNAARSSRVDEEAGAAVLDLVLDAADARGDDRPALPHRLGDGEAEALGEALLHDDVGAPLQRVDDDRVLVGVVHRQQREVDPAADAARAARARPPRPRRGPRRPRGRRRPPSRPGPASTRCGSSSAWTCSAKAASTPSGSLSRSQRETCATQRRRRAAARCSSMTRAARVDRARRCRRGARRPRAAAWWWSAASPAARSTAVTLGERHRLVLGRERVDRRRDHRDLGRVEPLPRVGRAREHVGVGVARRRAIRKRHASRARSLGRSSPMCARQITGTPGSRSARDHAGGLRVVQEHDVAGADARRPAARALAAQRRS